jgi:hypothetical protein
MNLFATALPLLLTAGATFAAEATDAGTTHRYVVERTFPKGALDGLDAAAKSKVNQTNAGFGVHWVTSYANADKTKTFCIYEGPNEQAIRNAASANKIPVDSITEVPVTLDPK